MGSSILHGQGVLPILLASLHKWQGELREKEKAVCHLLNGRRWRRGGLECAAHPCQICRGQAACVSAAPPLLLLQLLLLLDLRVSDEQKVCVCVTEGVQCDG